MSVRFLTASILFWIFGATFGVKTTWTILIFVNLSIQQINVAVAPLWKDKMFVNGRINQIYQQLKLHNVNGSNLADNFVGFRWIRRLDLQNFKIQRSFLILFDLLGIRFEIWWRDFNVSFIYVRRYILHHSVELLVFFLGNLCPDFLRASLLLLSFLLLCVFLFNQVRDSGILLILLQDCTFCVLFVFSHLLII